MRPRLMPRTAQPGQLDPVRPAETRTESATRNCCAQEVRCRICQPKVWYCLPRIRGANAARRNHYSASMKHLLRVRSRQRCCDRVFEFHAKERFGLRITFPSRVNLRCERLVICLSEVHLWFLSRIKNIIDDHANPFFLIIYVADFFSEFDRNLNLCQDSCCHFFRIVLATAIERAEISKTCTAGHRVIASSLNPQSDLRPDVRGFMRVLRLPLRKFVALPRERVSVSLHLRIGDMR